jgi:hypothetical protein
MKYYIVEFWDDDDLAFEWEDFAKNKAEALGKALMTHQIKSWAGISHPKRKTVIKEVEEGTQ